MVIIITHESVIMLYELVFKIWDQSEFGINFNWGKGPIWKQFSDETVQKLNLAKFTVQSSDSLKIVTVAPETFSGRSPSSGDRFRWFKCLNCSTRRDLPPHTIYFENRRRWRKLSASENSAKVRIYILQFLAVINKNWHWGIVDHVE